MNWLADKIEQWPTAKLLPYARNARTHSEEQVAQIAGSIREFGFTNPVLIDGEGGIIAGHGRVMAARKLGLADVPCIRLAHLTEAQRRAYVIADNKLALNAGWDEKMLALELQDLQGMDFDLSLTGFLGNEIDELLAGLDATPEGATDADETPEVQSEAITKPGDVWLLGKHRIMCGDSTDAEMVAVLMAGERPVLMITDPPYGVDVVGATGKIGGSVMAKNSIFEKVIGDDKPFDPSFLFSICPFGVVFGANYFPHALPSRGQWIVWDKGRPEGTTFSDAELAWTSGNGVAVKSYRCVWNGMVREGESGARVHPTQKPVKLMIEIMTDFSAAGNSIFEPFSGSGTTIIAAEQTGRRCYAMELSPNYVDVAVRRWQNFTGKRAVHADTGREFGE